MCCNVPFHFCFRSRSINHFLSFHFLKNNVSLVCCRKTLIKMLSVISSENYSQFLRYSEVVQTNNRKMFFANCFLLVIFCVHEAITTTPVVLWHGFGSDHLSSLKQIIKDKLDGDVYIKSIQLGTNALEDIENSVFLHPNDQISEVCDEITRDENLKNGFNAVGFSQGSQFLWVLAWKNEESSTNFQKPRKCLYLISESLHCNEQTPITFSTLIKTRAHSTVCWCESNQFHLTWWPTSRDFRHPNMPREELCDL